MDYREEKDFIGTVKIPQNAYWGVHSFRAKENFDICSYKISSIFIKSYGYVKLACFLAVEELNVIDQDKLIGLKQACEELIAGKFDSEVIVDPMQGGAGTSLNMNINEIVVNRALELLGKNKGDYNYIDPIEIGNIFQSTNDTFPTALKVASIFLLRELETSVNELQLAFQEKEKEFSHVVKVARTQLTDAVLTTLGKEFSAYAEAISRDRWRIYKCEERLRVVNLGGTAIGTGLGAPRKYIFAATEKLRELTGIGVARAENLVENTQNADVFAEVSGILKAHATNLIKIANDIRLLSSGPTAGLGEITLPAMQVGSSIMPGKVNPVIPEAVAQVGIKVLGNDVIINHCASSGQLELNQNMPLIAFSMIESLEILINANNIFTKKCVNGIKANEVNIKKQVESSFALLTALLPAIGYNKASEIAKDITNSSLNVKEYVIKNNILTEEEIAFYTAPEAVLALGHNNFNGK